MSLLRIVTGYRSEAFRAEVPAILYVGFDADAAKSLADSAPAEFHRVELLETRGGKRLRKQAPPGAADSAVTETPAGAAPVAPATESDRAPLGDAEPLHGIADEEPSLGPRTRKRT